MQEKSEKTINAFCICGLHTGYLNESLYVIMPCEHIIHQKCYLKLKYKPKKPNSTQVCPICFIPVKKLISEDTVNQLVKIGNPDAYQIWKDMNAMRFPDNNHRSKQMFYYRLPKVFYILSKLQMSDMDNKDEHNVLCKQLLDVLNIELEIVNKDLDTDISKVYVANHSVYIDPLIMSVIVRCGFVGSGRQASNNFLKDLIDKITPLIKVERGKNLKTVDKIKEFIKTNKRICIFPEGMMTGLNTIGKFRSGAFYTGYPVQPVVMEYTNIDPYYENVAGFAYRLLSQDAEHPIKIKITFLPVVEPDLNNMDYIIEKVRFDMAVTGNFYMSRITNREIKD